VLSQRRRSGSLAFECILKVMFMASKSLSASAPRRPNVGGQVSRSRERLVPVEFTAYPRSNRVVFLPLGVICNVKKC
jgi:hypothetical protein